MLFSRGRGESDDDDDDEQSDDGSPPSSTLPSKPASKRFSHGNDLAQAMATQILTDLKEARDALRGAQQRFRERHAQACKPHKYDVGDSVLLSTENIKLAGMPVKKLAPRFIDPFEIGRLSGRNAVTVKFTDWFQLLSPVINIEYLRPYQARDKAMIIRTQDLAPIEVEPDGQSWYEIEEVITKARQASGNASLCDGRVQMRAWIAGCHVYRSLYWRRSLMKSSCKRTPRQRPTVDVQVRW